mgnify:CR=1 FL=1
MFGDRVYVELQRHGLAGERGAEPVLLEIADRTDVRLVATNDCHFDGNDFGSYLIDFQDVSFYFSSSLVFQGYLTGMSRYNLAQALIVHFVIQGNRCKYAYCCKAVALLQ